MSGNLHTGDSLIGITVDHGRYEIVKLIGEGGMGRVFQARQVSMNRMVALKLLRAQLATDDHLLARFQQEAHAVSKLRHPNTIIVYDYGKTEDGYLFIAMELLGGRSLASILSAEQRLTPRRALHIIEQVAGAVAEAHQFGIVHRDLKPENIQIDKVANDPDFAKVLDFGIAKMIHGEGETENRKTLTMAGAVFGTPHYMSPEQVHGQKVDHRTDIYALGIILYELLTGKPIFEGATPMAVMMAQASKAPPDIRDTHPELHVPDTVADLINECLVKDADKRLGSANDLLDRLKEALYELSQDITGSASGRLMIDPSLLSEEKRNRNRAAAEKPGRSAQAMAETVAPVSEASTAPLGHPMARSADSLAAAATDDLDEVRPPKRGPGLFIALGAVAVLGAGAWFVTRPGVEPPPPQPPAPASEDPPETQPAKIQHEIESTPARATVTRDGVVVGKTPLKVALEPGEAAKITLSLAGYQDKVLELNGAGPSEQRQFIDLVPGPPSGPATTPGVTAWFHIESTPPDAEIWMGDKMLGRTPFEWKPGVSDKAAELRIAKKGFKVEVRWLKLAAAGAAEDVKVTLVPAAPGPGPGPATRPAGPGPGPAPATAAAPATKPPGPASAPATKPPKAPETKPPEPTYEKL